MQMRGCAVKPRILADDLQILSQGGTHLKHFEYAFNKTHKHIEDMGGRLAPTKSVTFASDETSRNWLRRHTWRRVTDGRGLGGSHECSGKQDPMYDSDKEDGDDSSGVGEPKQSEGTL